MEQEPQKPGERALELIRSLQPNWQMATQDVLRWIRIALAVGIVILGVLFILNVVSRIFDIKFWELVKVLALPNTVGAVVPWLNWLQKKREQDVEYQRAQEDRIIANARRQDEALQAYLDQMSVLLTDKERPLHRTHQGDNLSVVARARTLTAPCRVLS